ncbi:MAG TPA: LysM peptidoglycan-binding domain-containing protein [Patescibacteria group bacterium]|nr:LysM peptidoglycan-binding domain-containing protein [Patescibacteria group bacterium]
MKRFVWLFVAAFLLSGCTVRTYKLTHDRVDQDLTAGNQGYLAGKVKTGESVQDRKTTRTTQVVEIEMQPLVRTVKKEVPAPCPAVPAATGNRGYLEESYSPEPVMPAATQTSPQPAIKLQEYKVQSGDTLQKISQKFYGSSKKWYRIYNSNKDTLKGPDKIYPGQTIRVPMQVEPLQETKENLK